MAIRKFTKVKEDFKCLKCGTAVSGDGYTNHCPVCLYSRHVDREYPGDRLSECEGLMKPSGVVLKGGQPYKLLFKCELCGKKNLNKISSQDDMDAICKLPLADKDLT